LAAAGETAPRARELITEPTNGVIVGIANFWAIAL